MRCTYLSGWHFRSLSQCLANLAEEFFSSYLVGISHFAACVCSLLSFHWEECILVFSVYCFSGSGVQQLNPPFSFPFPTWTNTAPPASPPASSAQPPDILEVLPGLSPVWQDLSHTGGPKLVTGLQMQMCVLRRGEVTSHQGLVTHLLHTAQYVVSLHYHESALLTCVQLALCQGLHLLILSQSVSNLRTGDWVVLCTYSWVQTLISTEKCSGSPKQQCIAKTVVLSTSSREPLFRWHWLSNRTARAFWCTTPLDVSLKSRTLTDRIQRCHCPAYGYLPAY